MAEQEPLSLPKGRGQSRSDLSMREPQTDDTRIMAIVARILGRAAARIVTQHPQAGAARTRGPV